MPLFRWMLFVWLVIGPAALADTPPDVPPAETPAGAPPAEAPPAEPPPPAESGAYGVVEPPPLEVPQPIDEEEYETIIVISDPFSRWDGTRWFIKTEVVLPVPMNFYADKNYEFRTYAFQVRTILACEKDWKISKKNWQVNCTLEDFGMQAVADEKAKDDMDSQETRNRRIQLILDEVDAKLTGAALQLQVSANGRVTNVDLEGVEKGTTRENTMAETLRLVMSRVIVGFDMKLKDYNFLEQGIWTEYNPKLMSIPMGYTTSMGNSMLVHRLQKIDGHLVVESRGKGVISLPGQLDGDINDNWITDFAGVAVYSEKDAYMTERVWILRGTPTAATWTNQEYRHAGRIVQLDPDQKPTCGTTQQVWMGKPVAGIQPWVMIED